MKVLELEEVIAKGASLLCSGQRSCQGVCAMREHCRLSWELVAKGESVKIDVEMC